MAKKALGRSFDDIISDKNSIRDIMDDIADEFNGEQNPDLVDQIEISKISPNPFQPRKRFDDEALSELSQSISEHGLIQPIIVIKKDSGYVLIAGERRLRATKMLGAETIKAIVVNLGDKNLRELALIENIQREDLSPIELANSYKELIKEHNITQEELANIVKKSRTQITNTLRLLNLSEKTRNLIDEGKITQGHAKIIVGLEQSDEKVVVDTIIGQNLNVRETENLVKRIKNKKPRSAEFAQKISEVKNLFINLGLKCKISGKNLNLTFDDLEEIENLLEKLAEFRKN